MIDVSTDYAELLEEAKYYTSVNPKESVFIVCINSDHKGAYLYHQEITFVEKNAWLIQESH